MALKTVIMLIISHETFESFGRNIRKYKCLVGYSMVYHSKATDGARLAEMVRLPKMFEKLGSIFLEVTRHFCRIGGISEDILFKQ